MSKPKIDYGAIEKHGSMGKYDMFEAGRKEAKKMTTKMAKHQRRTQGQGKMKWRAGKGSTLFK